MHYFFRLTLGLITLSLFSSHTAAEGVLTMLHGIPVTMADINRLPPHCKLILAEKPGIHSMKDGRIPDILNAPQYHMARNNPHFHHYCWALISKNRYFGERTREGRNHRVHLFMGDIDYVIRNTMLDKREWPYYHVLYTEQAEMYLLNGEFAQGLTKVEEALKKMPDYEKAYAVKSDLHLEMGNKKQSIAAAQAGLEKNPSSRLLRNRLKRLGIKTPEPAEGITETESQNTPPLESQGPPNPSIKPSISTPDNPDATNGQEPTVKDSHTPSSQNQDTKKRQTNLDGATNEKGMPVPVEDEITKSNPYCRFCP